MLVTALEQFCEALGGVLWVGYNQGIARCYYGGSGLEAFVQAKLLDADTLDLVEGVRVGTSTHRSNASPQRVPEAWRIAAVKNHTVRLLATIAFLEVEPVGHQCRVDLAKHKGFVAGVFDGIKVAVPVEGMICNVPVDAEKAVLVKNGRIWIPSAQINAQSPPAAAIGP
ncbi:MAG: hypothetical protein E6Q76_14395 [Rhizobium sp.]|nr:MAG: hypothetical protein E6Q76_14395 [Rhizobium sp.]